MPISIAMAGKGGTGKTTVSGMLIKYLVSRGKSPILAVDADANANLNEILGLEVTDTLGNAREEMKKGIVPSGMTKDVFMSMKLEQAIMEQQGFDLVVADIRLPGREGTSLIPQAKPVPVLIMTSYSSIQSAVDAMKSGAADYIAKPFDHDELLVVIDRILSGRRLAASVLGLRCEASIPLEMCGSSQKSGSPGVNGSGRRWSCWSRARSSLSSTINP